LVKEKQWWAYVAFIGRFFSLLQGLVFSFPTFVKKHLLYTFNPPF
jgi:hypothetical protein